MPDPNRMGPIFLDSKPPHEALQMGRVLIGMLMMVADRNYVTPLLDWLLTMLQIVGIVSYTRALNHQRPPTLE
jgi:hypothetical protein